ncbi:MAG: pre-peptidase C-terminal domain-containing protein [Cyanobacteria bacterium J06629_2]
MTQVSLSTSTSFDGDSNALIEDQGTELTINLDLDEPAPAGGLRVFIDSDVEQIINRLDLPTFAFNPVAENINPASISTDFDNSGVALTIDEGATTASFTIPVFDNPEPDTFLPETFDGLVEATLSIRTSDEVSAEDAENITGIGEYTVDANAASSVVIFADEESQLVGDTPEVEPETPSIPELSSGYDEAIEGDISNDPNSPLELPLSEGTTTLSATTADGDQEYVTVTVPEGFQLDTVVLDSFSESNVAFIGVQEGDTFTEPLDDSADRGNILGFTLFGNPRQVGTDILDEIGNGLNAQGFEGALPSGTYTFALQQLGTSSDYSLDFNVSEATSATPTEETPEPEPTVEEPTTPTTPATGEPPVVSFEVSPETFSEEAENNLVEWIWTVEGDFPEEGITVNLDTSGGDPDIPFDFTNQFAATPESEFVNSDIVGFDNETGRLEILLTAPEASFQLFFANDIIEEGAQPFDFQLVEGEGYTVDPETSGGIFTITDDNGGPGVGPTVGISASATELVEGDAITIDFTVDGDIPEGGVQILVQSPVAGALGQFDISDLSTLELTGIAGLPEVGDAGGGSFLVTITEPTASITTSVFNDIVAEEPLEIPFNLVNGEEYEINPDASGITLNIADEAQPEGPTVSLSVNETDVFEGDTITLTFDVEGEIPEGGIRVLVNDVASAGSEARSLTEFDVANIETTGTDGFPEGADGDSGFFVNITEPTATITLPIFDEGADEDESLESFTFEVIDGEAYQVNPDAGSITLNIADVGDTPGAPTELTDPSTETPTGEPSISIDAVAATFDAEDNIIAPYLVDTLEDGTPILSVVIEADGEVPESGLLVNINTESTNLAEFVAEPAFAPFVFGGEFVGAIYDDAGTPTGFQVRIENARSVVSFSGFGTEAEGVQSLDLAVDAGEGYSVGENSSTSVTVYDTLEQTPALPEPATVGIDVTETNLIEGETSTTISFNVDGEIPEGGLVVSVDSGARFSLGEFDLFDAEVTGGAFPISNGAASGFFFKITDPEASITLTPRSDNLDPETGEASTEGIEDFTFELLEQPGYVVDANAAAVDLSIADDADAQIQVSLASEPEILIEEEGTVATFTINLSATPPEGGINVVLNSDNIADLNAVGLDVVGGGVTNVGDDGTVTVLVTEQTATVSVPVADDGVTEGLETAVFTLAEPGADAGYQLGLDEEANESSFDIYDTTNEAPVIVESAESDDTIATSIPIAINGDRNSAIARGAIDFDFSNNRDVDQTEDVDMYSVELQAGDRLTLDLDSIPFENEAGFTLRGGGDLRIFNEAGEELVYNDEGSAPGEILESDRDAFIDFTAKTAGTYYVGVSQSFNEDYDPNVKGTGDGAILPPRFGIGAGEYELNVDINPDAPTFEQFVEFDGEPSADAPTISFTAVPGTFSGDDIVSSQIVESLGIGRGQAAIVNFTLEVDGAVPEEGIEVIITTDTDITSFLDDLNGTPRTAVGAEILGAVYNEDGSVAGLRALVTSNNVSLPFPVLEREDDDPNAPEAIEFSLASSEDYIVDSEINTSNITFFDTLEQVQGEGNVPQVGVTIDQTELIESEGTEVNISFNVDGEIPDDGLLVYVNSETRASLGEFDVFNAEITGGAVPAPNGEASGFYFLIQENTANIRLNVFDETTNELIPAEDALEGIESFDFSIVESDGYTVNTDAAGFSFTIADSPDSVVIEQPEEPGEGDGLPELPTDNDGREGNNDTIANAVPLGLDAASDNLAITIDGEIADRFRGEDTVDNTEDVDIYSFDLQEGQTIAIDIDANGIGDAGLDSILDSNLRIFDAAGNELALNAQGAAPDEVFQAEGDPYLEFTAPEAGTYYAGISALGNDFYDPKVVASGSGWTFGESFGADIYQVNFSLGEQLVEPPVEPPTSDTAVVSLSIEPDLISEEDVEPLGNINFSVDGEIPADGLSILVNGDLSILDQVDGTLDIGFENAAIGEFFDPETSNFEVILTGNEGSISLPILNDIIQEEDTEFGFTILENDGSLDSEYAVNPDANSDTVTLTDGNGGVGIGPNVGLSFSETELSEGEEFTVNFNVDGELPEAGLTILVDGETPGILGEFALFDGEGNPLFETTGIDGVPVVGDTAGSSFLVTLTEADASITLSTFDDGADEGLEEFNFSLVDGEIYEVAAETRSVDFSIDDGGTTPVEPPTDETPETPDTPDTSGEVDEAVFDFTWTGQIAGFSVEGQFSYDEAQSYTDDIVREENLLDFDISFFDPDGNLLRTYEDNHLTFPEFNFAYDIEANEILQDGFFLAEDGINVGEKTAVGEGEFTGLNFWSRPEFNSQGEVPPPHLHFDDWSGEFGFPIGFSSHEDVAFPTRTTQELLDTGRLGETYIDDVQDSLDEVGERILVTSADSSSEPPTEPPVIDETNLSPLFGTLDADVIETDEINQLIFAGDSDDLIDLTQSDGNNRAFAGSGDDVLILGENNRIFADDGDDRIFVTDGGNNSINGNLGADQFWIANAEIPDAVNIINDFTSGEDVIGISGLGIGFSDLDITDFEGATLISANGNDLAIISNAPASFIANEDHFAFA